MEIISNLSILNEKYYNESPLFSIFLNRSSDVNNDFLQPTEQFQQGESIYNTRRDYI